MTPRWPFEILGTGAGLGEKVVTNDHLADLVDTSDEWIASRTGIRERRVVAEGQTTLSMALTASREALDEAGLAATDLDMIIFATLTPDHQLPCTACELQHALGARQIPAFDLNAACSGFVFSVITAAQFIAGGSANNILVIGAESLSTITDPQDRSTCILFGDAAAAAVMGRSESGQRGIISCLWGSDGSGGKLIWIPAGGAKEPASTRTVKTWPGETRPEEADAGESSMGCSVMDASFVVVVKVETKVAFRMLPAGSATPGRSFTV